MNYIDWLDEFHIFSHIVDILNFVNMIFDSVVESPIHLAKSRQGSTKLFHPHFLTSMSGSTWHAGEKFAPRCEFCTQVCNFVCKYEALHTSVDFCTHVCNFVPKYEVLTTVWNFFPRWEFLCPGVNFVYIL
jgi:hypothetical protein